MNAVCLVLVLGLAADRPAPSPPPHKAPPLPIAEGVVKGPDGKPLEKARVSVRSNGRFDAKVLSARTDAKGAFRIQLQGPGLVDLRAEAAGLAPRVLPDIRPGVSLTVTLERGTYVEGVVRDGATGRLVPGASVDASPSRSGVWVLPWEADLNEPHAVTDAKGRFRIEGLASQAYSLCARARGMGSSQSRKTSPRETVELMLFPGGTLSGLVADPDGKPLAEAIVVAESATRGAVASRTSDARGRFELNGLRAGSYALTARNREHGIALLRDVVVPVDGDATAELRMTASGSVRGRLLSPSGTPVAGRVLVQELDGRETPSAVQEALAVETTDGRFTIDRVPQGSHALGVKAPGFAPLRVDFDMHGRAQDLGDLALETGLTISGRVRDREGHPLLGAEVSAYSWSSAGAVEPTGFTTGDDGSFVLAGLDEGKYEVGAQAEGYATATRSIAAGSHDVDFVLGPAGAITGVVVDDTGLAVEDYMVLAQPDKRDESSWTLNRRNVQGADGRFLLPNVAPGNYALRVESDGYANGSAGGVVVRPGATTDVGKIRLARGGTIRGSVVSSDGAPVAGATVKAETAARVKVRFRSSPGVTTDASGEFVLRGVEAGRFNLTATHPQFASGVQDGIDVDPAGPPAEARIVLGRGGRIEGSARRRDGAPLGGMMVQVLSIPSFEHHSSLDMDPVPLTPDGSFLVDRVPAGSVRVLLLEGSAGPLKSIQERDAEVRDGDATTIDFVASDILVTGRVTRSSGPASGLHVEFNSGDTFMSFYGQTAIAGPAPSGPRHLEGSTDADGRYALLLSQPGHAKGEVTDAEGNSVASKEVEVPDADAFVVDFDLGGARVTGLVSDRDSGEGIANASVSAQPLDDPRAPGTEFESGPDGRFQTELNPGAWRLSISAQNYATDQKDVTIDVAGSDLSLQLVRGASLRGRVLDAAGRPARDMRVTASAGSRSTGIVYDGAQTLSDGSFLLTRLQERPYTIVAGNEIFGYAIASGVAPGEQPLTLQLRPPAQLRLRVTHADGSPADHAYPQLLAIDGLDVAMRFVNPPTDASGSTTMTVPAGALTVQVRTEKEKGMVTVGVSAVAPASGEIVLAPWDGKGE